MALSSAARVMGGSMKRRRGSRVKASKKKKRVVVKVKVKGSPTQVQRAMQKLSTGVSNVDAPGPAQGQEV